MPICQNIVHSANLAVSFQPRLLRPVASAMAKEPTRHPAKACYNAVVISAETRLRFAISLRRVGTPFMASVPSLVVVVGWGRRISARDIYYQLEHIPWGDNTDKAYAQLT